MTRVERRAFIMGTFALLAAPLAAEAQQARKIARIAFISTTASFESPTTSAFRQGLQELGYVEGQNILIEWRWGGGTTERLPTFAAEVIGLTLMSLLPPRMTPSGAPRSG
jgi:putative ABC transport system substrate-binding protein